MLLALVTVLASTPSMPLERATVRTQLDVGGMLGATWYVPQSRVHLEAALTQARGLLRGEDLDGLTLAYSAPLVGALLVARDTEDLLDRALLITSGLLQGVGLGVGAARLFADVEQGVVETGRWSASRPSRPGGSGSRCASLASEGVAMRSRLFRVV